MAGMFQGQQAKDAEAEARLKQQQDLQSMLFAQQEQPLKLSNLQATGDHNRALTRQANVTADSTEQATNFNKSIEDTRRQAFIDDAAAKHSIADIEERHRKNQMDLWSNDPQVVAAARKKFEMSTDILKRKMELEMQARSAANVASIGATARTSNKPAGWRGDLAAAKGDPVKRYSILIGAAKDPSVSEEDKAFINEMIPDLHGVANAALKNKASAWIFDEAGKMVPNPAAANPGIPAPTAASAPTAKPGPSQADLEFTAKKHGMTVEQVKAKLGIK
jgi:hypothetical protein